MVVDSVEGQIAKTLRNAHGLGLNEYRALKLLSDTPNSELRMQDLAALLGLNQSSVTRLVERLEKGAYTIRDLCPRDKRGVYTVLTGRGKEMQKLIEQDYEQYLAAALEAASRGEENHTIAQYLRQLTSPLP